MTQWKVCYDGAETHLSVWSILTDRRQGKLALSDEVSALDSTNVKAKLKLGLFSYPVLQAADILLYGYNFNPESSSFSLTVPAPLMFR